MASLGGYAFLGVALLAWLYMTYWVVSTSRSRGSRLWPAHLVATLMLGVVYAVPYWLIARNG